MPNITIYEVGTRSKTRKYTKFAESLNEDVVDEYLKIMQETVSSNFELVKFIKTYSLISVTPHIIRENNEQDI